MTSSKPKEGPHWTWSRKSSGKHNGQGVVGEHPGGWTRQVLAYTIQRESAKGIYTRWQHDHFHSLKRLPHLQCKEQTKKWLKSEWMLVDGTQ